MGMALEENSTGIVVRLEGAIDISSAAELKTHLVKGLGAGKELSVSVDHATYLDVTAIQLLWAAGKQAQQSRTRFSLSGHLNEPISTLLADAGIPSFPDSECSAAPNVQ